MTSPILMALLAVAAAAAYFFFGRGSSDASPSPTATPANGAAKANGAGQSAGRDFVKAMELAVSGQARRGGSHGASVWLERAGRD